MTRPAVDAAPPAGAGRIVTWAMVSTLVVAFYVLMAASTSTWDEVRRGMTGGFRAQLDIMAEGSAAGNPLRQASAVVLGAIGAAAFVRRRGAVPLRPAGAVAWLALTYVALCFVSLAWADEPALAARRAAAFALTLAAVAGAARLLPRRALVTFAVAGSGGYLLAALASEVARGRFHPLSPEYRLGGMFHPNLAASFCAVLVLALFHAPGGGLRAWARRAAIAAGLLLLALTRTRTAFAAALVTLAFYGFLSASRWRKVLSVAVVAWLGCAALLVTGDALGREVRAASLASRPDSHIETLSGRTALWSELLGYAAERPVLGYGLGSFWTARRLEAVYASQRWPVAHAHCTYLEQVLEFGLVGAALFVLATGAALWRAARSFVATGDRTAGFSFAVILYFLLDGCLETQPEPGFLTFVLYWTLAALAFREVPRLAPRSRCAST